jgi:ribosomal protein S18 acetylase RimI-like enzyme
MPPTIHHAQPQDAPRYRALRLAALADTPDAFGSRLEDEQPQPDAFWTARLQRPNATTLLAQLGDLDAGLAVVAPAWDASPKDAGLYSVWVAPHARGQGVGEALLRAAIHAARAAGFARLVLEVGDLNAPAVALYARLGFEPTGRTSALPPPRQHILEHERALSL